MRVVYNRKEEFRKEKERKRLLDSFYALSDHLDDYSINEEFERYDPQFKIAGGKLEEEAKIRKERKIIRDIIENTPSE